MHFASWSPLALVFSSFYIPFSSLPQLISCRQISKEQPTGVPTSITKVVESSSSSCTLNVNVDVNWNETEKALIHTYPQKERQLKWQLINLLLELFFLSQFRSHFLPFVHFQCLRCRYKYSNSLSLHYCHFNSICLKVKRNCAVCLYVRLILGANEQKTRTVLKS